MDKRTKTKLGAGLAALAALIACGGYYFFHTDTSTPAYALKSIQVAVEKHDTKTFYRLVDVDAVLDSGCDAFIEGLTMNASPETKEAVNQFAQILRGSLTLTLKSAIDSYVSTGDLKVEENLGVIDLLNSTGLNNAQVRDIKNIQVSDADRNEAFADLIIFQPELNKEFPLHLILTRNADKEWQVTRVQNFKEYVEEVAAAARASLNDYLAKTAEINSRHEAATRDAEQKYGLILTAGNLSQKDTRNELKALIEGVVKKDWEARKQEIFSLPVPRDAQTLHNLYMKICDTALAAVKDYSKWLDDNNPATIKSAEEKIHQLQTLQTDAAALAKRMAS